MAKLISFLFILLLLCGTESKAKPIEHLSESPKLECTSPCKDEKIKVWYQKKYGEPITGFELSAKNIFYEYRYLNIRSNIVVTSILVTRTATGAIVAVTDETEKKIELNMEEWLDFIRILSKLRIDDWEEVYYPYEPKDHWDSLLSGNNMAGHWTIKIISSETFKSSGRTTARPSNFKEFEKAMRNMKKKVEEKSKK